MSAFFFGPADSRLYGYFHEAAGLDQGAVLLCAPWAREYQFAHRTLKRLADRLASRGHHVLRFDYSGTGDSWGESTDAEFDRWVVDAGAAIDELCLLSGRDRVDVVGLRFGCMVAARLARGRGDVDRVLLWDPVVDGPDWVDGHRLHDGEATGAANLDGTQVHAEFLRAVGGLGPDSYPEQIASKVWMLVTQPPVSGAEPANPLPHVGADAFAYVPQAPAWEEDPVLWTGLVPAEAVAQAVAWIAGP